MNLATYKCMYVKVTIFRDNLKTVANYGSLLAKDSESEKFRRLAKKESGKKGLVFCRFSSLSREIPELEGKGHEPSRAENCSARALARASSARAHHYQLFIKKGTLLH